MSNLSEPQNSSNNSRTIVMNTSVNFSSSAPGQASVNQLEKEAPADAGADIFADASNLELLQKNIIKISTFAIGGQGVLSQAVDNSLHRRVAVKSLRPELASEPRQRKSFITEACITAQLEHPSIIPIHSIHQDEGNSLAVVMKLIHGENFQELLNRTVKKYQEQGFRSSDEAVSLRGRLEIFLKICDALEYAHSHNVMHCDLKPENFMIGEYHDAYLMDWGIAHPIRSKEYDPETWIPLARVAGTPRFISPETMRGDYCDQRSDIYSMGMILFETVMLHPAIDDGELSAVLAKVSHHEFNPPEHLFAYPVDSDMKAIIRKATEFRAEDRYQQISELSADIRKYMRQEEVSANPDNFLRRIFRSCVVHHGKALAITALACLLAVVGLFAFSLANQLETERISRLRNMTIGYQFIACQDIAGQFDHAISEIEHNLYFCGKMLVQFSNKELKPFESANQAIPVSDYLQKKTCPASYRMYPQYGGYFDFDHVAYLFSFDTDQKLLKDRISVASSLTKYMQDIIEESPFFTKKTGQSRAKLFDYIKQNKAPVSLVYFAYPDGFHFCYPGKIYKDGYDPRKRIWYQNRKMPDAPLAGWSTPYLNFDETGLVMTYSMCIEEDKEKSPIAALDLDISSVLDYLQNVKTSTAGVIEKTFVDEHGVIISTSNRMLHQKAGNQHRASKEGGSFGYQYPNNQLIKKMQYTGKGYFEQKENGRSIIYVYAQCRTVNWFYFEKVDLQKCMKESQRLLSENQF